MGWRHNRAPLLDWLRVVGLPRQVTQYELCEQVCYATKELTYKVTQYMKMADFDEQHAQLSLPGMPDNSDFVRSPATNPKFCALDLTC